MRVGDGTYRDGKILTDPVEKAAGPSGAEKKKERRPAEESGPEEPPSPFARILHSLGREVDRGEKLVSHALGGAGGKELGNVELLALQAGVYRYSEAVDLTAKLVDRAASGVKTVIQGQ